MRANKILGQPIDGRLSARRLKEFHRIGAKGADVVLADRQPRVPVLALNVSDVATKTNSPPLAPAVMETALTKRRM